MSPQGYEAGTRRLFHQSCYKKSADLGACQLSRCICHRLHQFAQIVRRCDCYPRAVQQLQLLGAQLERLVGKYQFALGALALTLNAICIAQGYRPQQAVFVH
jgi:hypothetical protein